MDDDELLRACRDRGFTPGRRHVASLVEAWRGADRGDKKTIVTALSRGDAGVAAVLMSMPDGAPGPERAMRLRVLGRIHRAHPIDGFEESLLAWLADQAAPVVREAARVVAKLDGVDAPLFEDALLSVGETIGRPEKKAVVDALGRVGGARTDAYLRNLSDEGDPDLRRRIEEARALLQRRAGRRASGRVVADRPLPAPTDIVLRYRADVGWVVAEQLGPEVGMSPDGPTRSLVRGRWTLEDLHRARSAAEVGLRFVLPPGTDVVERIVAGLKRQQLQDAVSAWTEGPPRFRLTLVEGGRQRSIIWKVARALASSPSHLINDSRDALWTIEVDVARDELLCLPRHDRRFDHRQADVPAASHPTLAATLAWIGAPRPGETVWDPFCGSGGELIECARLRADGCVWGTDVSEGALEAARANVAAAGLDPARTYLRRADARTATPPPGVEPVSLIVTNPPMGRRVAADGSLKSLLAEFIDVVARTLGPGGRLVWVTPLPEFTAEAAEAVGLQVENLGAYDMGGFTAGIQRLTPRA